MNLSQVVDKLFISSLLVLFIGLKLTGYISWSWWWVLAPAWIPIVLGIALYAVGSFFIWLDKKL